MACERNFSRLQEMPGIDDDKRLRMKPVRLTGSPEIRRDVFDALRVPDHHISQRERIRRRLHRTRRHHAERRENLVIRARSPLRGVGRSLLRTGLPRRR